MAIDLNITGSYKINGVAITTNGVTSVTATSPVASSGGTAPTISMPAATSLVDGYLSAADWATFNGKQAALVSGTTIKTINSTTLLGSGNIAVEPTITAGTTGQYYRGDKTFQTLDKTAVGLANVDNTSDASKPISTATQTALNAKQDTLTLTTTGTSGAATLVGATLNIPQYIGGVTSVTGTAPVVSSGGTTPAISMPAATTSVDGYLTSTNFNTFNNKQAALVSGTNIKTINGTSVLGSGDLVVGGGGGGANADFLLPSGSIYSNYTIGLTQSNATVFFANNLYLAPFKPANTFTTSNLFFIVGTASSAGVNARILLYASSTTTGLPTTKIYESANLACSTTGVRTAITTQTFTAGTTYWLAMCFSGTATPSTVLTNVAPQLGLMADGYPFLQIGYTSIPFGSAPDTLVGQVPNQFPAPFPRIGLTSA